MPSGVPRSRAAPAGADAVKFVGMPTGPEAILELARKMGLLSESTIESLSREAALQALSGGDTPVLLEGKAPDAPELVAPERFQELGVLGEGTSGRVVKAFDRKLQRQVALKLLLRDDERSVVRFLREAQAQARVEHAHVCRVFDVTEHGGRACIAMELVEGGTLSSLATEMTLEQRVRALAEVAEAVQAAHEQGLLHRDLKPGNVLVQRTAAGFRPVVADFGLAQELDASATATGRLAGTPQYMAPEQARSESALDRRADVWGLGATAYAVLVGRPPFEGSVAKVLWQVVHEEPPAPRAVQPRLPRDLETVLLTCLRKDPSERYDSARELAEELRRWLRGEPVLARRPGLLVRGAALARRWPKLTAGIAAAAVITVGSALWLRARVAGLTETARVHGRALERAELGLRLAYALPLHDVTKERDALRTTMREVARGMDELPGQSRPQAHAVLGHGHLALGELADARRELEEAVRLGDTRAAVAADLGIALGRLYQRARAEAERLRDPAIRQSLLEAAERDLRGPAVRALQAGRSGGAASPIYLEGLAAELEGRDEDAARLGAQAAAAEPQLAEGFRLVGEARSRQARAFFHERRHDRVRTLLEQSGAAFERALDVARSDPELLGSECWRLEQSAVDLRWTSMSSALDVTRAAVATCEKALLADPLHADAPLRLAVARGRLAVHKSNSGEDTTDLYQLTLQDSELAIARQPLRAEAWRSRAEVHRLSCADGRAAPATGLIACAWSAEDATHGLQLADRAELPGLYQARAFSRIQEAELREVSGSDPRPVLDLAIPDLEEVVKLRPEPLVSGLIGFVMRMRARAVAAAGGDFRPDLDGAEARLRESLGKEPTQYDLLIQTAFTLTDRAELESGAGADPSRWSRPGLELLDKLDATAIKNPDHRLLRCRLLAVEAESAQRSGPGAPAALGRARSCFDKPDPDLAAARLRYLLARAAAVPSGRAADLREARTVQASLSTFEAARLAPLVKQLRVVVGSK